MHRVLWLALLFQATAAVAQTTLPSGISLGATVVTTPSLTAGAQNVPTDADVAQVLRALAILRGTPAIVPINLVATPPPTPPPTPTPPPPPPPPPPPFPNPLNIHVIRDPPFGSIPTEPRNLGP